MATRKRAGSKRAASVEPERSQAAAVAAKLPEALPPVPRVKSTDFGIPAQAQYPAVVLSSLVISYLLYTITSPFTSGDLATVSTHRDAVSEVALFLSWRAAELAIGWYNGYDSRRSPSATIL